MKKTLEIYQLKAGGELAYRIHKSQARLESKPYRPEDCREKETPDYDWPADWIGRALLGNILISEASGSESAYANRLLDTVFSLENEKGYLGIIQPEGIIDEQQLSGHNWLLRALLEHGSSKCREHAERIVKNLFLPAADYYEYYPVTAEERVFTGEKSGTLTGSVINHWKTSSDTGCAFMCLDGLASYYAITKDAKTGKMLDKMIAKFTKIDFNGIQMQTHASLSATRGMVKYYIATGRKELLEFAEKFVQLYKDYGMTANYANYNWFCRQSWTEPCAIIDSYMLFSDLFSVTGKTEYLKTARRIYFNAICFAQRDNGGFGCDKCTDITLPVLRPDGKLDRMNEAFWCCTMRGGEGLARVLQNMCYTEGKIAYFTPVDGGNVFEDDFFALFEVDETQPTVGKITVEIMKEEDSGKTKAAVYVPDYAENVSVSVNGNRENPSIDDGFAYFDSIYENTTIEITYSISFREEKTQGKFAEGRGTMIFYGDRIVGIPEDDADKVKGVPDFAFAEDGTIVDSRSGVRGEFPGKNIDCMTEDGLRNQSIKIIF